jgi:hypothetical protein
MFGPCYSGALLALEAQKVMELRLVKLAWGGLEAHTEAQLMFSEKVSAALEAAGTLLTGGSPETVIARYRKHVAANTTRLSAAIDSRSEA